jgi:hypothetical protein
LGGLGGLVQPTPRDLSAPTAHYSIKNDICTPQRVYQPSSTLLISPNIYFYSVFRKEGFKKVLFYRPFSTKFQHGCRLRCITPPTYPYRIPSRPSLACYQGRRALAYMHHRAPGINLPARSGGDSCLGSLYITSCANVTRYHTKTGYVRPHSKAKETAQERRCPNPSLGSRYSHCAQPVPRHAATATF